MKFITKTKYGIPSIFIILVSIVISIPMFMPNFNIQYDDGIQHIYRLIGTYDAIKDGQVFPVIMPNLCNGFGYSWNLFYSPFTAYIPLIFKLFGCSFEMCLKLFIFGLNIASGFSMFFFVKKILKNKLEIKKIELIAILAATLYILSPYRLNDMYIRIAVSELASFVFLPIIFNGLYSIVNLKEKSRLLIWGAVGMLLTHSMLTIYVIFFCLIYLAINIKELNKKKMFVLVVNAIVILGITAFYWIPLLESKLSANYEVFNSEHMIRWDIMNLLKVNILELLIHIKGRMIYEIGMIVLIGILLSILAVKDIKDKRNYLLFLILGIISVIMTLDIFPFEKLPSIFTMMQFSFRMLEFSSFFLVVVASIALGTKIAKFNIFYIVFFILISILLLIPSLQDVSQGRYYIEEELIKGIKVTQNTGRVHAGCASFEYLTDKGFANKEYIVARENIPIILNNKEAVTIEEYYKNGTECSFKINTNNSENEKILIELPYMYYIGYNVEYEEENGESKKISTFESENGFIAIEVQNKNSKINVKYTGTTFMRMSYFISILTAICVVVYDTKIRGRNIENGV